MTEVDRQAACQGMNARHIDARAPVAAVRVWAKLGRISRACRYKILYVHINILVVHVSWTCRGDGHIDKILILTMWGIVFIGPSLTPLIPIPLTLYYIVLTINTKEVIVMKSNTVQLRLTDEEYQALVTQAKREKRSVSNMLGYILAKSFAQNDAEAERFEKGITVTEDEYNIP